MKKALETGRISSDFSDAHAKFGKIDQKDMSPEWQDAQKVWNDRHARAKKVYESLSLDLFRQARGLPLPRSAVEMFEQVDDWKRTVDETISKNLDHQTIPHFIRIVLDNPNAQITQALLRANQTEFSRRNGVKSGERRRELSRANPADVMRARDHLIREGTPARETASLLAERFFVSSQQIRNVVKKQLEIK